MGYRSTSWCAAAVAALAINAWGQPTMFQLIEEPNFRGAVVPADTAARQYGVMMNRPEVSGWAPDLARVRAFEARLPALLEGTGDARIDDILARLSDYVRQYLGIDEDGRRRLFVLFACEPPPDWLRQVIAVEDGGDCYFDLTYDLDADTLISYAINGEA